MKQTARMTLSNSKPRSGSCAIRKLTTEAVPQTPPNMKAVRSPSVKPRARGESEAIRGKMELIVRPIMVIMAILAETSDTKKNATNGGQPTI